MKDDLISKEETLKAFSDYVGSGMSMNDFNALWDIVAKMPPVKEPNMLDKIRAEIEEHAKINQNLNKDRARALCWYLDVIDKYKAESEEAK